MKTVLDKATRDELIARINTLNENSKAQWGTMNVYQMLKHNTLWEEWVLGKRVYKRQLPGYLFGRIALKSVLKDESPLRRGTPTFPDLKITGDGSVSEERAKWIALIEEHAHVTNHNFVHTFFGKMTNEQIGQMAYKHADHHLRQFNS